MNLIFKFFKKIKILIKGCSVDSRRTLYENILISGGTSMFPGFPTRLENDVRKIY